MTWAAPNERDSPSIFTVTPPNPSWPIDQQRDWMRMYSRHQLAVIAIHEVAPGHFSHGRALRRLDSDIKRSWQSTAFTEGWAHYCEELAVELAFADGDPAFTAAVARDGLLRVTRLVTSIGLHTGELTLQGAAQRYVTDAHVDPSVACQRAARALFEPTIGDYTVGKLAIQELRDRARSAWGSGFDLARFRTAIMDLGAPPLGLLDAALDPQK